MQYTLMNDYTVTWPFWGGRGIGLCLDEDPVLPNGISAAARSWASQFNEQFSHEDGWPNRAIAIAHREEGEPIFREAQRLLPEHDVTFQYWERAFRDIR